MPLYLMEPDVNESGAGGHLPPLSGGIFVNPFTDFGFKRIFGQEMSKEILMDFLNHLLAGREAPISDIQFMNTEQVPELKTDRRAVFDLYCKTESGERIIVEMQVSYQKYMVERSLYYATFPIRDQAPKGSWDFSYSRVYVISILDFNMRSRFSGTGEVVTWVGLCDVHSGQLLSDRLSLIFLEMRNFTKLLDECETHFDKWLYLIRHLSTLKTVPAALQHNIFKMYF